jgi:hypothetical protein
VKVWAAASTLGGDKANGKTLGEQVKLVATHAAAPVILANTGHWC